MAAHTRPPGASAFEAEFVSSGGLTLPTAALRHP